MKRIQFLIILLVMMLLISGCKIKSPEQYYDKDSSKNESSSQMSETPSKPNDSSAEYHISTTIRCDTILNNMDKLEPGLKNIIPKDGILLKSTTVSIKEKETAYDVLMKVTKANKLIINLSVAGDYIIGINGIKEFSVGPLSGWKYRVNGEFPGVGFGAYELKEGDVVEFLYTCNLGADLEK